MERMSGKIVAIKRDDMVTTSARIIFADIECEDGAFVQMNWVDHPDNKFYGYEARKHEMSFETAWQQAKVGDNVQIIWGVHGFFCC